ncbi:two-component system sensor histidine kinase PmrB [Dickeya fangzhongdai]|uniref:two-component system sensor histidine kinase PmrB n=1 Tax=Dickeya fangzhongdai TaxID=1778540 RepID=UPI0004F5D303|nr:two-component system sensor histidine kinase PmrB [Dickeya fangzhongdai]AIR70370.1 sensor protein BasS/PmrB [Dickeya fangzhongdai]KGT98122.1 sensor protein BasS/PmrB [Dickeya fangzhongdai]KHN57874.1 sensor protein BasS/PmrB [Dickeya fangzhongdai]WPD74498.1 two-component system sensor histidine kinase PmrB [Dickeya fangzhongdai]
MRLFPRPSPMERTASIRTRLILTLGCILLACQLFSVVWLWHESEEQIQLLVEQTLTAKNLNQDIALEVDEAIASLSIPSLVMVVASLVMCAQAITLITRPLMKLQDELHQRTAENLEPLQQRSDVTEVAAVIASMNQLFVRFSESLRRDRLFASNVAHELRTPLAGIRLSLELHEQVHHIDCQPLIKRVDHLTKTIEQLLLLARVGNELAAGHYESVSLVDDVITPKQEELEEMATLRHQQLDWQSDTQTGTVPGNATLLQLLLRNLVENAYRYSPENSTITVRITDHSNGDCELIVADEGPGINESQVGELTKAFVRMDTRYGGIGLGLSIVTRIVQLHHGEFFLENRRDRVGTQARVVFKRHSDDTVHQEESIG